MANFILTNLTPMTVWAAIVAALCVFILASAIVSLRKRSTYQTPTPDAPKESRRRPIIEFGSEREELYVPGDPFPWKNK